MRMNSVASASNKIPGRSERKKKKNQSHNRRKWPQAKKGKSL